MVEDKDLVRQRAQSDTRKYETCNWLLSHVWSKKKISRTGNPYQS